MVAARLRHMRVARQNTVRCVVLELITQPDEQVSFSGMA